MLKKLGMVGLGILASSTFLLPVTAAPKNYESFRTHEEVAPNEGLDSDFLEIRNLQENLQQEDIQNLQLKEMQKLQQKSQKDKEEERIKNEIGRICKEENWFQNDLNSLLSKGSQFVLRLRAKYNITKDANLFNKYLPYRNSISNNPIKLAQYEKTVRNIIDQTQMGFLSGDLTKKQTSWDLNNFKPLDSSTRYMVSATIVELLHNKPKLIENILTPLPSNENQYEEINSERQPMSVKVFPRHTQYNNHHNKEYGTGNSLLPENTFLLENERLWAQIGRGTLQYGNENLGLHEWIHFIDNAGIFLNNKADGVLTKMTKNQKKAFLEAREELFKQVDKELAKELNMEFLEKLKTQEKLITQNKLKTLEKVKAHGKLKENDKESNNNNKETYLMHFKKHGNKLTSIGLRQYTFRDYGEFLADTVNYFYYHPNTLYNASPRLYDVYRDYFNIDPLNGYIDLEQAE